MLIYLLAACATEDTGSVDGILGDGQQQAAYGDFLQGLKHRSVTELPSQIHQQEEWVTQLERDVLQPLEDDFLNKDSTLLTQSVVPASAIGKLPEAEYRHAVTDADGSWSSYLQQFSVIDSVSIDVHEVLSQATATSIQVKAWIDIRGQAQTDGFRNDRGWVTFSAVRQQESSSWTLNTAELVSLETISSLSKHFVDRTQSSGFDKLPEYPRLEALRRGGYAISTEDIDSDGDSDLFIGGWGESKLYLNNGQGSFEDITERTNLRHYTKVKAAAVTDMDNDGDKDIVLSRFVDTTAEDLLVLYNDGSEKFTLGKNDVMMTMDYDRAMPLTVADFNNDGLNDIYVGFPGAQDFTFLNHSQVAKSTQGMFYADGEGGFKDATVESGIDVSPEQRKLEDLVATYPHAVASADFNGDGQLDILVADDRRGATRVYQNIGDGRFSSEEESTGLSNKAWAMGIAIGDYDGDGLADVYFSNIDFLAAKRIQNVTGSDKIKDIYQGNKLYRNLGDGSFEDVTEATGLGWTGEAAAGAQWLDYDADGDLDLYVTNGLWSGPGKEDLTSLFVRAYLADDLRGSTASPLDIDSISLQDPGFYHLLMDVLSTYSGSIEDAASHKSQLNAQPSLSMGGHQRNMLFRNNGNGSFTEVGYIAGVDSTDDGYMSAITDVNGDGALDLILRNCDPGTSHMSFPALRIFHNTKAENTMLTVKLVGNGSTVNRDAIGARIELQTTAGSQPMVRELATVNGAAQSEIAAFFGVGQLDLTDTNTRLHRIAVHWPDSTTTILNNVNVAKLVDANGRISIAQQ